MANRPRVSILLRLQLALHVLMGKPAMFGVRVRGPVVIDPCFIAECDFKDGLTVSGPGYRIWLGSPQETSK